MKTKVRLLRTHYLNGIKKVPGNVLRVDEAAARWLVERGIAAPLKPQQTKK